MTSSAVKACRQSSIEGVLFLLKKLSTPLFPSLVRGRLRSRNTSYLQQDEKADLEPTC